LREADKNIENVLVSDGEIELRILIGLFVLFSHYWVGFLLIFCFIFFTIELVFC
jgi:hypothetical protein